ncbi:DUF4249 family protein [Labilibaculum sp. A4]|uniref:DUF4249 domain-containing protein n=1 Tax=Labilibaculum euxinus TaxID=2686357 RepID=UPI000F6278C9|nr:DUF4249 domain-containing protein [Labilibaculum euxinus]MDQ1772625.1 DUF4249 domain-containing protein [Labilibaculum euxinus]MWN78396.1 DUF4249 family protein [Labilibaculum euxinus]
MSPIKSPFCWALALILLNTSCTEKFYPEIDADVSILVVDGKITNDSGPYEVRLFRTVDLISVDTLKPEANAEIILKNDLGNSELFQEIRPGVYQTVYSIIKGEVGQTYWIEIETATGEKYESTPEKMPPPFEIESIYGKEEEVIINASEKQNAVKIYFDAKANSTDANYIRWEYRESYEWRSPENLNSEKFTENPSKICYPVTTFPVVNIYDASNLSSKFISQQSTSTIYTDEVKLLYNYLIDITLFSVSETNYEFWKKIKSVNFSEGALYDITPANIEGNISGCDEKCKAIGYFEVSSVNRTQNFFSKNDFTLEFANYPKECQPFEMRMEDSAPDPAKFHILSSYTEGRATIYVVRRNECYECNVVHPSNKPSFWPKL